jgi:hypothetical protein
MDFKASYKTDCSRFFHTAQTTWESHRLDVFVLPYQSICSQTSVYVKWILIIFGIWVVVFCFG